MNKNISIWETDRLWDTIFNRNGFCFMRTGINGEWNGAEISENDFIQKRMARKDFQSFIFGQDNSILYQRAFKKTSGPYFARLLVVNGAFNLQFDESEKDEAVNQDISYLLKHKRELELPRWFVHRLKNIENNWDFWVRARIKQRHIDWALIDWLDTVGFKEFAKNALHYLDSLEWGREAILSADERRRAEGEADCEIVASVSYLIARAAHLKEDRLSDTSAKGHIEMHELVVETTMYLYHKQKMLEACYFGGQYSLGLLSSDVAFYESAKSAVSGVYLDNMYQQEDMANKRDDHRIEPISYRMERETENHSLLVEAKAYGIPLENFESFQVFDDFTFHDVLLLSGILNMFVATKFQKNCPGMCGEISHSDLLGVVNFGLLNHGKSNIACGLIETSPIRLMDLYLTPFVEIDGTLFFSTELVKNDNLCRNIATNSYKKQKEQNSKKKTIVNPKETQKGTLFEKQVEKALLSKLTKVYHGIEYSITLGGIEEKSDIDVLALEGKVIHVVECKSELTPMDYFDYRRDSQMIDHANYQLERAMLFLNSSEGKQRLINLFGAEANECSLSPCLVISNGRSSCEEYTEFPIFSFYELEMALDGGALKVLGKRYKAKSKREGVFPNLEEKTIANLLLKSTGSYLVISNLLFIWQFRFQEFILIPEKFNKALSKTYLDYQYDRVPWKDKHPKTFVLMKFVLVMLGLTLLSLINRTIFLGF